MKSERVLVLMLVPIFTLAAQTSASPGQTSSPHAAAVQSQSPREKDQPQSDLSDAARRAREERELQRARRSEGSEAVSQMANELSEATEPAPTAPVGYRYYNFRQGDYSILVPADAEVEGRDSYGLKLLSSEAMGSRTIVILGDPIPAEGDTPEEITHNASKQYLPGCGPAAGGSCPFHNEVLGSVRYFPRDGYVMPVICGYPYIAEDLVPNSNLPIATIVKRYDRERNGYRACDTVLPSLRFNDHGSKWHPKTLESGPKRAVVTNALLNSDSILRAGGAENDRLGNFARLHRKVSSTEVLTELKHTSPGFSSYGFNYCSKDECFAASLQIPEKAHKDEQFQASYSGLFEFVVPVGDTMAVIQASKGTPTKPGIISREEFINTKVDWWIENVPAVYFSGAGKAEVFSEALTTLSGMPARLATFRSPTAFQPVITQLVAYMAPGVFVQIRCSAPEKVYADAQSMCEHVVRSLDVPKSKTEAEDAPQTPDDNDP